MNQLVDDPWARWRGLTAARIGLARSGASLATRPTLDLRLAHARARDAVETALDVAALQADLAAAGHQVLCVESAAPDRRAYKLRPDLGRVLAAGTKLPRVAADLVVVVADGLSALAVQRHAVPLLVALRPLLNRWRFAPVVIARQGRVALGDAVALAMGTASVLVLIGERPGLSAPDSMGAYMTWRPAAATTDAERNCVSNIRPDGLAPADAAHRVGWLLTEMRRRDASGVAMKDAAGEPARIAPPIP
jgi:ethanolamine ammonia-lyase small subunit